MQPPSALQAVADGVRMILGPLSESLSAVVFPPQCGACTLPLLTRARYGLCAACLEIIEPAALEQCTLCGQPGYEPVCRRCQQRPPAFASVTAPFVYGGPVAEMLTAAKFQRREDLAVHLGELLAAHVKLPRWRQPASLVVPVPLGRKRRRERGYNQAVVLARALSLAWAIPLRHLLVRTRDTLPQSSLDQQSRRQNVTGAFAARGQPAGTVILVDDVVTSTETVQQAALALLAAGANEVHVVALARAAPSACAGAGV